MKRLFYITVTALFLSAAQSKSISQPGFNPQAQRCDDPIINEAQNEAQRAFNEKRVRAFCDQSLREGKKCINLQMQHLNAEEQRVVSEFLAVLEPLFTKLKQCAEIGYVDLGTRQEIMLLLQKIVLLGQKFDPSSFCANTDNQQAMEKVMIELMKLVVKGGTIALRILA